MRHERQSADDCLDRNIVNLLLELFNVDPLCCELLEDARKRTLVPDSHIVRIVIEYEFRVVLIYSVVSEMNILLLEVGRIRLDVGLSCQPGESFFEHVQSQRISSAEKNVDSEVEL